MKLKISEEGILSNKAILNFMGVRPTLETPDVYSYSKTPFFMVRGDIDYVINAMAEYLDYSSSWDLLMPVVHKCLSICHENMLNEWEERFCDKFMCCDRYTMYKEVVGFITFTKNNNLKWGSQLNVD